MKRLFTTLTVIAIITACTNHPVSGSSTSKIDTLERNKQAALADCEAFSKHDTTALAKGLAANAVDYGDGIDHPVKGIDSIKTSVQTFINTFPDVKGENLMAIAEGNHVAVFGDWSGTFKGNFMGLKPTGKSFHIKDAELYTFNDEGKITERRSVQEFQNYMMQVGAIPR